MGRLQSDNPYKGVFLEHRGPIISDSNFRLFYNLTITFIGISLYRSLSAQISLLERLIIIGMKFVLPFDGMNTAVNMTYIRMTLAA